MSELVVIHSGQAATVPLSVNFNSPMDGDAVLLLAGSCWAKQAGTFIGFAVLLDGTIIAKLGILANVATQHMAVVSSAVPVTLSYGQHTLSVQPFNTNTQIDTNDVFEFSMLY